MVDYESKKLAQCFIQPFSQQIQFPSKIFNEILPLGKNVVAVIPGDSKKLTFFLTNAKKILFVKLILDKSSLNEAFFTSLRETMIELKIENLFSTGVCFKEEVCVWEGVFEFDKGNFDEIKEKLSKVTHVKKAKYEELHV
ncbi:MAG: hypothetical protein ACTSWX_02510 [Promethearchaeota archaeon]